MTKKGFLKFGVAFSLVALVFVSLLNVKDVFADATSDDPHDLIPCAKIVDKEVSVKRIYTGLSEQIFNFGGRNYTTGSNSIEDDDTLFRVELRNNGCNKKLTYVTPVEHTVTIDSRGNRFTYSFACVSRGKHTTSHIDDAYTEIEFWKHEDNYDYFYVLFTPKNSGQQQIAGAVKVVRYRLYAQPINVETRELIDSRKITESASVGHTDSVDGKPATVTKPNITGTFKGWATTKDAPLSQITNAGSDTYSRALCDNGRNCSDKIVYAFYELESTPPTPPTPSDPEPEPEPKKYRLHIDQGAGTNIYVYRNVYTGPLLTRIEELSNMAELTEGDNLSVLMSLNNGYSWTQHLVTSGSFVHSGEALNNYIVGADVYVTTRAALNSFEGKSSVGDVTTGWRTESDTKYYSINNCDFNNGCEVTLSHYVRRMSGADSLSYTLSRELNFVTSTVSGTENFSVVGNNSNGVTIRSETVTLKPGQMVCEQLSFKVNVLSSGNTALRVCALALGELSASLNIGVKNSSVAKYNNDYVKSVYAKPGDNLNYRTIYEPKPQAAFSSIPRKVKIDNGQVYSNPRNGITLQLHSFLSDWNNAFTIIDSKTSAKEDHEYSGGDATTKTVNVGYVVQPGDVGSEFNKTAKTNERNMKITPSKVQFTNSDNENLANIITNDLSDSAKVAVPYNFDTSVSVDTDSSDSLTAGGDEEINYTVKILPKTNKETTNSDDQAYATIVRGAISEVILYTTTSGGEGELNDGGDYGSGPNADLCSRYVNRTSCEYRNRKEHDDLNNNGDISNGDEYLGQIMLNVPDVNAGLKFCVAVAFFPSNSGADTNLSSTGSNTWRISNSKCFSVGKRPTFQVWGGSFYSSSSIDTSTTAKKNLADITMDGNKKIVFGSWVEQSVIANGEIRGLASGAASGLANNPAGGGSLEKTESYCVYRVPLNIANFSKVPNLCPSVQITGKSGVTATRVGTDDLVDEESAIVDYDLNLGWITIGRGETYVAQTTKNVTISGDIIYADGNYAEINDVPKAIIVGENINIKCGVKRIDAILVAKNNINTCADSGSVENAINSNQLVINGAVVANSLTLNRTFGAATGIYSKIPAEIINYDTSILMWGRKEVDEDEYNKVHQVYLHEMAPRY